MKTIEDLDLDKDQIIKGAVAIAGLVAVGIAIYKIYENSYKKNPKSVDGIINIVKDTVSSYLKNTNLSKN